MSKSRPANIESPLLLFLSMSLFSCSAPPVKEPSLEQRIESALHGPCDYREQDALVIAKDIQYPDRPSTGTQVELRGIFGEDQDQFFASSTCESPREVEGVSYGSRLGAEVNGDHVGYWMWIRCGQMVQLAACQGRHVEVIGTYQRSDVKSPDGVGSDRIIDIRSVRLIP